MYQMCKKTGPIASIPSTPGLVVWNSGHIGISLDGVWAIEARGFNYGIVKTRIRDRSWTRWGELPASMLDYVTAGSQVPETPATPADKGCPYTEPSTNLKKGAKGDGVRWVQWMLTECGYSVGRYGVDGDFGNDTRTAVRTFQKDSRLSVDAIVGPLTRAALKAAYEKKEAAR